MRDENKASLSKVRLDKARECLFAAQELIAGGSYSSSANRSYYAIFHAMRAVLALDGFDSKRHSGIISEFQRRYIKPGIFPKMFSKIIKNAFDTRNSSDYEDFFVISKTDVQIQLENAETFLAAVEAYIEEESKLEP